MHVTLERVTVKEKLRGPLSLRKALEYVKRPTINKSHLPLQESGRASPSPGTVERDRVP